ncbi:hypothetical protein [Orlajensenia flava]|uniref:hypothetical protein n=1 Tax=Orlajensenia flava TaxID=2565934 RepID=UPI0014552805|nr:hypothetical protein [Glaciibacter flavus]
MSESTPGGYTPTPQGGEPDLDSPEEADEGNATEQVFGEGADDATSDGQQS